MKTDMTPAPRNPYHVLLAAFYYRVTAMCCKAGHRAD